NFEQLRRLNETLEERIAESKRDQLRIQEQAALLDKAQDAISVVDFSDRILYWNQSAERLYGWRAAEAGGRNAREGVPAGGGARGGGGGGGRPCPSGGGGAGDDCGGGAGGAAGEGGVGGGAPAGDAVGGADRGGEPLEPGAGRGGAAEVAAGGEHEHHGEEEDR